MNEEQSARTGSNAGEHLNPYDGLLLKISDRVWRPSMSMGPAGSSSSSHGSDRSARAVLAGRQVPTAGRARVAAGTWSWCEAGRDLGGRFARPGIGIQGIIRRKGESAAAK
jgi:hypothetical protein